MLPQLQRLQQTVGKVTAYAEKFPREYIYTKPDAKAFSANEIIYHLLEVEELWQRRLDQLLHTEDHNFQQIDPDALAKVNLYNEKSYDEGIANWNAARKDTVALVHGMTAEQREINGMHSRYGEMNTFRILEIIADHDLQHLHQMERTLMLVKK